MYEYKIQLNYKIENCTMCPFRHETMTYENVQSLDLLSGILNIARRHSHCMIRNEAIVTSETVEGYNSNCPLKGTVVQVNDKN